MIIERVLTDQIDTKDPNVLYSTDLSSTLKVLLADRYVGKCFMRCYITEVIAIEMRSPPVLEAMRNGGSARVAVTFRVRGVVYDQFEVIPDAKIMEVNEDGKILLRSKHAAILLAANPKLQKFRVGMVMPVRAVNCSYIPYRSEISVQGIPFTPLALPPQIWDVQVAESDIADLEPALEQLRESQKRLAAAPHQAEWCALLDAKPPRMPDYDLVELAKIRGGGQIVRPEMPAGDSRVFWHAVKEDRKIKNSGTVLRGFVQDMTRRCDMVAALAEHYDWTVEKTSAWVELYRAERK